MPSLTDFQSAKIARALRRGAVDSFRIADALSPTTRTHFLIEVQDMGQFATDWNQLKTIIRQKDDAIDRQSAQLAAQSQQVTALQQQLTAAQQNQLDPADQTALAELHQAVTDNTPTPTPAPSATAPLAPAPSISATTTFTK
jgi:peptidoglycan hydrolase CwlO-like protein